MLLSTYKSLLTALGINKNLWPANGSHTLDMQNLGLMFTGWNTTTAQSNHFGYPHLGRPSDHYQVTPFEAIYCDPQTYQHIKMQESIGDDGLNEAYLVYLRNFILDEVEADIVCLQNKTIGKNHLQTDPNYKYKAWYKAYDQILIGNSVTPKTDAGDYIIESTGDISVKAQNSISIKPGFHAQAGSDFHAFIGNDGCSRPRGN